MYFRDHGIAWPVASSRFERDLGLLWVVQSLQELLSSKDRSFLKQSSRLLHGSIPVSDDEESEDSSLGIDDGSSSDYSRWFTPWDPFGVGLDSPVPTPSEDSQVDEEELSH